MMNPRRCMIAVLLLLLVFGCLTGVGYAAGMAPEGRDEAIPAHPVQDLLARRDAPAPADLVSSDGVSSTAPAYTLREEIVIMEGETPLAASPKENECCILHFLLMLCALGVAIYYTHDRKRRQQTEFELRAALRR